MIIIYKIIRYTGFATFAEMQEFIKNKWDNKLQQNIKGHGFDGKKHFFEVEFL